MWLLNGSLQSSSYTTVFLVLPESLTHIKIILVISPLSGGGMWKIAEGSYEHVATGFEVKKLFLIH